MTLAYITCKNDSEAEKIAIHLLKKRLIACANLIPIKSMYRWKLRLVKDKEVVLLAKTNDRNFKKVELEVKKMHSYKIPCILKLDSKANKEYNKWVNDELKKLK